MVSYTPERYSNGYHRPIIIFQYEISSYTFEVNTFVFPINSTSICDF
jgi:hypothetical protein